MYAPRESELSMQLRVSPERGSLVGAGELGLTFTWFRCRGLLPELEEFRGAPPDDMELCVTVPAEEEDETDEVLLMDAEYEGVGDCRAADRCEPLCMPTGWGSGGKS